MSHSLFRLAGFCVFACFLLAAVESAVGQEWADKMFETRSHDFGTVATGSQPEFKFELQNIYEEDVHISSIRTSCGCVKAEIDRQSLATWENATLTAKLVTQGFQGDRAATVTIVIDRPYRAEVQLSVRAHIRRDVALNPQSVRFGNLQQGEGGQTSVEVAHTGRQDWKIVDVRSTNEHFDVGLVETQRSQGVVRYRLDVRVKPEIPSGMLADQIVLISDDRENQQITVQVEANVVATLTVSPRLLDFGEVRMGESGTMKLAIRSRGPFQLEDVRCGDDRFHATPPEGGTTIQMLPIEFKAAGSVGRVEEVIHVITDQGKVSIRVTADVVE